MSRFLLGSYATFPITPATMPLLKQFLLNQQAVAFSGRVLQGYVNPPLEGDVFCGTAIIPNSGHGQLLVGYWEGADDAPGGGAFRIQNSFGAAWPPAAPGGQLCMAYASFLASQRLAAVAYPRNPQPSGSVLTATNTQAPAAYLARSYQWAPDTEHCYLILWHALAAPITLTSVGVREPGANGGMATGQYGAKISTGYTYLKRSDSKQFRSGAYQVTLTGTTLAGEAVIYTGTAEVGEAQSQQLTPATMVAPLWDTTGAQVIMG
jgi:hypothetical protein